MSPYLIPDTQALCYHLPLIRQLATSGRFIIIIPRTGKFIWEAGCRWRVLWDHCICGLGQVLLLVNCSLSIGICAKHCCKRYGQVNEKLEWKRWVSCYWLVTFSKSFQNLVGITILHTSLIPCRHFLQCSLQPELTVLFLPPPPPASDRWPGFAEKGTARGPGWDPIPGGRV